MATASFAVAAAAAAAVAMAAPQPPFKIGVECHPFSKIKVSRSFGTFRTFRGFSGVFNCFRMFSVDPYVFFVFWFVRSFRFSDILVLFVFITFS